MPRGAFVFALGILGVAAACAASSAMQVPGDASTDGTAPERDGAVPPPDARSDSGNHAGSDTGSDTGTEALRDGALDGAGDGSRETSTDGGRDAGCDASWCACQKPHSFCEDFDDGGLFGGFWNVVNGSGTVTLDDAGARSAPYSVRFVLPSVLPVDGGTVESGPSISSVFGLVKPSLTCALDLSVGQEVDSRAFTETFAVTPLSDPANDSYFLYLRTGLNGARWVRTGGYAGGDALALPSGWFRYEISITPAATTDAGTTYAWVGSVNGVVAFSLPLPELTNDGFSLTLGMSYALAYAGGSTLLVDNVTCDW